jgi:ankyrin repeat protein
MKDGIPELQTIGHVLSSVSGRTALHYAARNGMEQIIVKLLSEKRLKWYIRDSEGQTAWHKAAKYGHYNTLRHFIKCGANRRSRIGETPDRDEASDKMKNFEGFLNTALHLAAKYGRGEVVSFLLDEFPDICPLQNHVGATALSLATMYRQSLTVELILTKAAAKNIASGLNTPDAEQRSPIHYAALEPSGECLELFLAPKGLTPEAIEDAENMTPLHFAAIHGYLIHIERLLRHDMSLKKRIKSGHNALELAVIFKNWRVFGTLWSAYDSD